MKRFVLAIDVAVVMFLSATPAYANHHERSRCEDSYECDDNGQSYDQWNGNDRNRNRNRNRGAFSPGPFDRSPIEMHDVCISLDCSARDKDKEDKNDDKG